MSGTLCLLLIQLLYWQHVASRHIAKQPFYSTYSDYSYTGPGAFHQSYQHHNSAAYFSPAGTYFDQRQRTFRPFPGGGVPVQVDYHKLCSNSFVGLKANPSQQQYYYVCKPDCVIFGKCQNLQIYNATSGQCAQHPPPEYIPTCTGIGRFPVFSNCHLYIKCDEDLQPKIYSCPASMIFSPITKTCTTGSKCTSTQISPQSSYMPEICSNKFPPCFENGIFRSSTDCSLYYKCDLKNNGVFMQTRLQCPQGDFYDLLRNECLPAKEVSCDCIQVAELVYPSVYPAIYPEQFDIESMAEGQHAVEQPNESATEIDNNCIKEENIATTISTALDLSNELIQQNDLNTDVLSEHLTIEEQDNKAIIREEELMTVPNELVSSSEATESIEGSGFDIDSEKWLFRQAQNDIKESWTVVTAGTTEDLSELSTTIEIDKEMPEVSQTPIEDLYLTTESEILSKKLEQVETTIATVPKETEAEESAETTTTRISARSIEPKDCVKRIENGETDDLDTQHKHPAQTRTKHKPTESMNTSIMLEKLNEQDTTTQLPTTIHTISTMNLVATEMSNETFTTIPLSIDSDLNLETAETIRFSEKTSHPSETNTANPENEHQRTNNLKDISCDDVLTSKIRERQLTRKFESQLPEQANNENGLQNLANGPLSKTLKILHIHEILQPGPTTVVPSPQATTIKSVSNNPNKESLLKETTEQTTEVPMDDEVDETEILDSEIKIGNFKFATKPMEILEENLLLNEELSPLAKSPTNLSQKSRQENISTNEKFVTLSQVDFSDDEFIPVRSQHHKLNEIEDKSAVVEKGFDYDFTTIVAEKETTIDLASTITKEVLKQDGQNNEISSFHKVTKLIREQTSLDDAIQTTTRTNRVTEVLTSALDSESVIPDHANNKEEEEVSYNVISSAETIDTTSNLKQRKQIFHSPSTPPLKTITQTTTATNSTTRITNTTFKPSKNPTNIYFFNIRQEDLNPSFPVDYSPLRKSLCYNLKNKPVINIKTINKLVTETHDIEQIPRLEIIAARPIDIRLSICPSTCDSKHKHKKSTMGRRAVLLKWFARKSKQTLGFETDN